MTMDADALARWNVAGHDAAVEGLATAVAAGRVSHAYLITGLEGVGRTTLALALARALNCEAAPGQRPCNECDACRRIVRHVHPDIVLADMQWQETVVGKSRGDQSRSRQRFSIDAIKWLREDIVTRPILGRWKMQIIDDAGKFSTDAPEAFLKTLEEPPPYAVIVLIAESADQVAETIRSRCRHIALGAVPASAIRAELIRRGVEGATAERLSRGALGRVAWAVRMAEDPRALEKWREQVETAFEHLTTPLGRITITGSLAREHTRKRDNTFELLDIWTGLWRDALLLHSGLPDQVSFPHLADRLEPFAQRQDISGLYRALWATQRAGSDLDHNVQARIALHAMVMQWPD
ncbi:MAG TPA: DNA polymerase III subunit [Thermomicrobiales bacterium]|nr:DNA polymerase III subunit [Thermomicrobiales bacterium]